MTGAWRNLVLALSLFVMLWPGCWLAAQAQEKDRDRSIPPAQLDSALQDADQVRCQAVMCGPNSLYMLLALHDVPVGHQLLEKYIPSHREGMSLLELKEASAALGLHTEVRCCPIDELWNDFESPIIASLREGANHHYIVVIGMTNNSVTALDGTTGEIFTVKGEKLKRAWLGYVLMPDPGHSVSWLFLGIGLFDCLLLSCFALKVFRSRSSDDPLNAKVAGCHRGSFAVMLVVALCFLSRESTAVAGQFPNGGVKHLDRLAYYRTPENDAANCLYLQLRLLGHKGSYEAFREQLLDDPQSLSLASLAELSRRFGYRLAPVKMTVSELSRVRSPVLVYFEESGIGNGGFFLFLGMNETKGKAALIDGAYVTLFMITGDDFRRKWTGYALIAQPSIAWSLWLRRGTAALVVADLAWMAHRVLKQSFRQCWASFCFKGASNADYKTIH